MFLITESYRKCTRTKTSCCYISTTRHNILHFITVVGTHTVKQLLKGKLSCAKFKKLHLEITFVLKVQAILLHLNIKKSNEQKLIYR